MCIRDSTYDDLDFMDRDWRFASSLKIEQKAQFLGGQIQFPVTSKGYRDSMSADMNRTAFEGQTVTSSQLGIKRTWGPRKREQYLGANYLIEQQDVDGGETTTKKAVSYTHLDVYKRQILMVVIVVALSTQQSHLQLVKY